MANPVIITDNGTDISNSVDWKTIDCVQVLTKENATLKFNVRQNAANLSGVTVPAIGDTVELYDPSGLMFGGTVTEVEATIEGLMITNQVTVSDWGYLFNGTLVKKNYAAMDPADIVNDIVSTFCAGKGFTTNHVQRGNFLIATVKFNYQQPTKALQSLATLIGWDWYIDANKDIHFFLGDVEDAVGEGGVAPVLIDQSGGESGTDVQWNSLDVDLNLQNMQNSVYVIGGMYIKTFNASNTIDTFPTDGVRQFFSVSYGYFAPTDTNPYENPIVVTLDGVPQAVGVANTTDPATVQVLYNDAQKWIQFTAGAPGSGHTVKVYGGARVPIVASARNALSIASFGEYQTVISDTKILSVQEAQQRAKAAVLQFGHPVYDVKFNTLIPGCRIGQVVIVSLPAFGIEKQLVIKRIEAVGYVPGANGMLQYQVECIGSDNVTFVDLMTTVLQEEANQTPIDDSTITENLEYADETITVSESVSATSQSRPYLYGPTSPQARYGFSCYS